MARKPILPEADHQPPTSHLVSSSSSNIKRAKAVTETARERLARTNQVFERSRQLLKATEETFHHLQARREYEAEQGVVPSAPVPPREVDILLIEDSLADATLFRHVLKECGLPCQLTVLSTGEEVKAFFTQAMSAASPSLPRLIIADCMIPGMEAEDIVSAMRTVPAYQQVPVILFSSLSEVEGQRRCAQCGATAFIHKPGELEAFVEAMSMIVHRWGGVGDGADPPSLKDGSGPLTGAS